MLFGTDSVLSVHPSVCLLHFIRIQYYIYASAIIARLVIGLEFLQYFQTWVYPLPSFTVMLAFGRRQVAGLQVCCSLGQELLNHSEIILMVFIVQRTRV